VDEVQDIEREIGELRRELLLAVTSAKDHYGLLAELEARGSEASDRLLQARKEAEALQGKLERRQADLVAARRRATVVQLQRAVAARDTCAERTASAIDAVIESLQELDRRRAKVARARTAVAESELEAEVSPEPETYTAAQQRLIELVRSLVDEALEDELLDTAARSRHASAIDELPSHLREAARRRRRELAHRRRSSAR